MLSGSWVGPGSIGGPVRGSVAAGAIGELCRRLEGGEATVDEGVGVMWEGNGAGARSGIWGGVGVGGGGVLVVGELVDGT
jgi:hypothetical protein